MKTKESFENRHSCEAHPPPDLPAAVELAHGNAISLGWRQHLTLGVLLPRGRFAWWYSLLGCALAAVILMALVWGLLGTAWFMPASVVVPGLAFALAALLAPVLASKRLYVQDYPVISPRLLVWQGGVVIGMTVLLQVLVNLFEAFVPEAKRASETVSHALGFGQKIGWDVALVLGIAAAAPLGEELLFRGLIYRSLRDGLAQWLPFKASAVLGLAVSSALFAVVHVGEGQVTQWPALFVVGVLLALAYEWTGSLLAAMLIHSLNNAWAVAVTLMMPGISVSSPWLYALVAASPLLVGGVGLAAALLAAKLKQRSDFK